MTVLISHPALPPGVHPVTEAQAAQWPREYHVRRADNGNVYPITEPEEATA